MLALMVSACTVAVSKEEAEKSAVEFVKSRVKFYTTDEATNTSSMPGQVIMKSVTSYKEGREWVVIAHMESEVNSTLKKGDIIVKIDAVSGEIVEFNGVRVIRE